VNHPLSVIQAYALQGAYNFVLHARKRLQEREVTIQEVMQIIRDGYHEARRDEFKPEFGEWNYAIRGKTLDDRKLRLAIAIKSGGMLVITAIDLEK
jgi:adenine-specific DNA methylase